MWLMCLVVIEDGSSPILGYVVEKLEEGSDIWDRMPGIVEGESRKIIGLKEGIMYKFRDRAEHVNGVRKTIEKKTIIIKNTKDTPDAPKALQIKLH